ncbi:MAG: helix-turn-helix domain-containing protein [Huintestinicola sp.]|uniref:helix-turn-helix domain-containing protein n=1 Tax=Huintestinicola sp. TaxID=2981661 RepID=UPI003F12656D
MNTKAKISTACDLLRNTSLRYIEIAYSLGFSTQSMFIRTFKCETGLTPKKYREQNWV